MKLIDLWSSKKGPTISMELFPARTEKAAESLEKAIDELAALRPDFVSVTFGAGGSTRDGSRQLVEKLIKAKKLEVVAYFAGYGLGPDDIASVLESYNALGVENVLAVGGDPPHDQKDFVPHPESFSYASDLIAHIKPRHHFCLGAAGYPEGHIKAESKDRDIQYLKLKADNGADFIICNYFYDNRFFFDFLDRCKEAGIRVPILPGIMPVYSVKMMETLAGICGATITDELRKGIAALPEGDKDALVSFGIDFAAGQCRELIKSGAPGLHFYSMDRSVSVVGIVNRLRDEGLLQ
jgi:methylenetetrahydrofolate reductase (NADPH)